MLLFTLDELVAAHAVVRRPGPRDRPLVYGRTGREHGRVEAIRVLLSTSRQLVEPAGTLAIAGLLTEGVRGGTIQGRRIGVIQSGGNADTDQMIAVWQGGTPSP